MERNTTYQYCRRTITETVALWRDLCAGHFPAVTNIRLRRKKDDRVRRLLFDEVRRAFLTPIDRDDLWGLCLACGDLLRSAEDVAVELQQQGRERLPDVKLFWNEVGQGCEAIQQAMNGFPRFQRQEDTVDALRRWTATQEQIQKIYDEQTRNLLRQRDLCGLRLYDNGRQVADCCETVARRLLTAILKNE